MEKILESQTGRHSGINQIPGKNVEKLSGTAETIPVSHISSNWKENMMSLAQLTDKEKKRKNHRRLRTGPEKDKNKDQQQSETVKRAGHQNQTRQYLYLS